MNFPLQQSTNRSVSSNPASGGAFDMRNALTPRRLTLAMWDQAYLLRHVPGQSYADYDRVLDETLDRGYNTLRLDPLPQLLDLKHPEKVFTFPDPQTPYMPWGWDQAVEAPLGAYLLEFMPKVLQRKLNYTLSAWWFTGNSENNRFPKDAACPTTHLAAAELWLTLLRDWEHRFGFDGLVYVDLANEVPFFLPGFMQRFKQVTGQEWDAPKQFSEEQVAFLAGELNPAMAALQREFPQLRFTASIHGDPRWLDVPLQFDCLDVHFYADADPSWKDRTRFGEHMSHLFTDASWHKDFSERCTKTYRAVGPMMRARQRNRLAAFARWSAEKGMPLTTSESWASWYYYDSPDLDWGWLLEWAEASVDDALEYGMWGWTPHNYVQPQFENWKDARWHRRLTDRFLQG